ncbi:MAG: Uroporphyrinogen decarboxylase [bacterium]|nr:Uroporphyrinogen decarboxylase [bacterium]
MNGRERVLGMIEGQETDSLPFMPITMMFAADRAGVLYGDYARDHRVLVEAQLRVAEEFDIDHVSAISDPAREAADCGATVAYFPNQPPAIDEANALLADKTVLTRLKAPAPGFGARMRDRVEAVALFKERVGGEKAIEGWVEGPCAEAADLRGINTLLLDFYDDPGFVRDLFEFVIEMELDFAKAQIDAGADLIGVGDAAASLVSKTFYEDLIWPFEKRLVSGIHALGGRVRLHICGDTRRHYEGLGRLGCEIVDLDWMNPIGDARKAVGRDQVLLGNIDPVAVLRNSLPRDVYCAIEQCHRQAGRRYIVSAGCEVPRDTPPENMEAMRYYARTHGPS